MRRALLVFGGSRAFLALVLVVLPPLERYPGRPGVPLTWKREVEGAGYLHHPSRLLDAWLRHDATYYLQAALVGYEAPVRRQRVKEGFFPGYPLAVRAAMLATRPLGALMAHEPGRARLLTACLAAVLVSNLAALAAVVLLVLLVRPHLGEAAAGRAGVALAVSPLSFLLSAALSEPLFLAFILAGFLAADRGRWAGAGALCGLGAFTRAVGVGVWPVLGCRAFSLPRGRRCEAQMVLLLVPAGMLAALVTLGRGSGDPLVWFRVQEGYGHGAWPAPGGLLDLFARDTGDAWEVCRDVLQVAFLGGALLLGVPLARAVRSRRLPWDWFLLAAILVAVPALSGHPLSLPRYLIVVFPLYAAAALVVPRGWAGALLAALSMAAQGLLLLAFEAHLPLVV